MDISTQAQKSGDSCVNIQAENITFGNGLTYAEVRDIALDVFRANFYKLSQNAQELANQRAEEITNKILAELQERNPAGVLMFQDPDIQYAIFTAQKEYARTGDKNIGDLLVNILVDRSKETSRSLKQIVLNESLNIVPKLTKEQLNVLSLYFLLTQTFSSKITNLIELNNHLAHEIAPFTSSLPKNDIDYKHMEFAGCGAISIVSFDLVDIFIRKYSGLFIKGIPPSDIQNFIAIEPNIMPLFCPCFRNDNFKQFDAINDEVLKNKFNEQGIHKDISERLITEYSNYRLSKEEIKRDLFSRQDCMSHLFDVWDNSHMKNMTLTSVGITIAHAHIRSMNGDIVDLSDWID